MRKFYLVHCTWGEWGEWGECSKECGDGTRTKTREKIDEEDFGGTCTGYPTENEPCKIKECTGIKS